MSVYASCAYECAHKVIGSKIVKDLNNEGIPCFFAGDIPDDIKYDMLDVIAAANDRSEIFMPFLCREYEQNRLCCSELAVATSHEKLIMPVVLDPDFVSVTPGSLLTGTRIIDISSSAKYQRELPEIIRTIRAMIPGLNIRSGRATGSAAGDKDA